MSAVHPLQQATAEDLARLPDETRAEVIDGVIVEKAAPSFEHGDSQFGLSGFLRERFHGGGGGGRPGGWWIAGEIEIELAKHQVFRPDLVGWRRERAPERPSGRPIRVRPDWVCEVLSPSNAGTDLVRKFRVYARFGVPHYWVVDPDRRVLTVYRCESDSYTVALVAEPGEVVRAEPFDAVELAVGLVFGDESEPAAP